MSVVVIYSVVALLLAPLAMWWLLWLLFALLALIPGGGSTFRTADDKPMHVDVLIPAHNEEALLAALLESLAEQTAAGKSQLGTVLVIADHCKDATASIARSYHVQVLERQDGPRGKPAALRDGLARLRTLAEASPVGGGEGAIAIIDADCTVSPNLIEQFAAAMKAGHKAAQCAYVIEDQAAPNSLSTIAFSLKNVVRPRGMAMLGIPTQLFGTGMCFHDSVLAAGGAIQFNDHLTEDLAASHDLLRRKIPPVFLAAATVRSPLPTDDASMATQKLRWETGQVQTWKMVPGLLLKLVLRGQLRSAVALVDWSAPPVAMAVAGWCVAACVAGAAVLLRAAPWELLLLPAGVLGILVLYIAVGTLEIAGPAALVRLGFAVPRFFFWKLRLYGRMATGRGAKGWQKSRADAGAAAPPGVRP